LRRAAPKEFVQTKVWTPDDCQTKVWTLDDCEQEKTLPTLAVLGTVDWGPYVNLETSKICYGPQIGPIAIQCKLRQPLFDT
jgi:hypothetical protein